MSRKLPVKASTPEHSACVSLAIGKRGLGEVSLSDDFGNLYWEGRERFRDRLAELIAEAITQNGAELRALYDGEEPVTPEVRAHPSRSALKRMAGAVFTALGGYGKAARVLGLREYTTLAVCAGLTTPREGDAS